jgi:peptidoglycan biosynthesis protein MviN/MurJ (putative lipid II flippase)
MLLKQGIFVPQPGWVAFGSKVFIANLAVGFIYFYDFTPIQWYEWSAFDRAINLGLEILAVLVVYVVSLFVVGVRPHQLFLKS